MNLKTIIISSLLLSTISGSASANYELPEGRIGDALENLWAQPACGDLNLVRGALVSGLDALTAGSQETLPLSDGQLDEACEAFPDAVHVNIAQRQLAITRNNGEGGAACEQQLVSDIEDYSSDAPEWAEALQLVYGGRNGEGAEGPCADLRRRALIGNWGKLWADGCDRGGDCEKLRYAFRPGDDDPTTEIFRKLIDITAFCNGNHFEDKDPLRTDCFDSPDVDYCDPSKESTHGVVQAVHLADFYESFNGGDVAEQPRRRCTYGNSAFAFSSELNDELFDGNCPDNNPPIAGFLCLYPRDCNNDFGCINSYDNPSGLDPLMDGRLYNMLRSFDKTAPWEAGDITDAEGNPIVQLATLNFNGDCVAELDEKGENTSRQIGCLVNRVKCSMGVASKAQLSFQAIDNNRGESCGQPFPGRLSNEAILLNNSVLGDVDYPLVENLHFSANGIPANAADNALDCDAITNPEEQKACRCVFDNSITTDAMGLGAKLAEQGLDLYPGGPKAFRCAQ